MPKRRPDITIGPHAIRHVPPGKGKPKADPPNAWDTATLEGKDWPEITDLLEETTEIAEVDWAYRHLIPRRNEIWARLARLGITQGRMRRAYAIDGTPITSHVAILSVLKKLGVETAKRPTKEDDDE